MRQSRLLKSMVGGWYGTDFLNVLFRHEALFLFLVGRLLGVLFIVSASHLACLRMLEIWVTRGAYEKNRKSAEHKIHYRWFRW